MDDVVTSLAEHLNKENIIWGVGGSYLLKEYGIVDEVHDLDIIVSEEDVKKTIEILDSIAERKTIPVKNEYRTKHFHIYSYRGVSIDVMSNFRIEHDNGVYEFLLDDQSIVFKKQKQGVVIPFTSLEDWLIAYKLMKGREEKVELIENYFRTEGLNHRELLERTIKQELPEEIRGYIRTILKQS
ncbi:MAG: hypothetical protein K9L62_16940 [Vallitaleaceae bacterium]|nr:hypothetical protein [Vallitaleaceae bacterium]